MKAILNGTPIKYPGIPFFWAEGAGRYQKTTPEGVIEETIFKYGYFGKDSKGVYGSTRWWELVDSNLKEFALQFPYEGYVIDLEPGYGYPHNIYFSDYRAVRHSVRKQADIARKFKEYRKAAGLPYIPVGIYGITPVTPAYYPLTNHMAYLEYQKTGVIPEFAKTNGEAWFKSKGAEYLDEYKGLLQASRVVYDEIKDVIDAHFPTVYPVHGSPNTDRQYVQGSHKLIRELDANRPVYGVFWTHNETPGSGLPYDLPPARVVTYVTEIMTTMDGMLLWDDKNDTRKDLNELALNTAKQYLFR
jgi:hypothetical protein